MMTPILKKGPCCLSLRRCAIILGSITLVGNLLTLSMFVVGLDIWLNGGEPAHWNHTEVSSSPALPAAAEPADVGIEFHHDDYFDDLDDSEAMEDLIHNAPHFAMVVLWVDFTLVILETVSVFLLIVGAAMRVGVLLLPWLAMELLTKLYDIGFFTYLFILDVHLLIDVLPILLLPLTVYCWLVVFSLYQECRETARRNATMPLSMSALEAGQDAQQQAAACTVPYGRMAAG